MAFPYNIIDLTHTIDSDAPSWNGGCGFQQDIKLDYGDCAGDITFRVQQIKMHAGIGTHIDAPAHYIPGGATIDQLSLSDLIVPCVMIDVSPQCHDRYMVSTKDIQEFECAYGLLQPGCFVMIRTGWERFWNKRDIYRNEHVFPSVSGEVATYLLGRQIVGLGIDTLSPDRPDSGFPVHACLLGAGKYIVENAAYLEKLPPVGSTVAALPIKTRQGTEAPIRLVAFIPQSCA